MQPADPAAASSSPLWSLILAGFHLVWPARWENGFTWVPLLVNLAAGGGCIWLWHALFAGYERRWLYVLFLCFVTPLNALSLLGMEHTLHLLLATALAWAGACALADDSPRRGAIPNSPLMFATIAMLAVAARYESLFLAAPLVAISLVRRRISVALAIGLGAAFPVLAFGALWMHTGGWLLPNPLLLKGINSVQDSSGFAGFLAVLAHNLTRNMVTELGGLPLLVLACLVARLMLAYRTLSVRPWRWRYLLAAVAAIAAVLQIVLASVGWLYRYKAWLLALNGLAALLILDDVFAARPQQLAFMLALFALLLLPRSTVAMVRTVQAIDNRRLEHMLPAEFVRTAYPGQVVTVNDLGAVAYFGRTRVLDMFGLGNNEPIRLRSQPGGYDAAALRRWAEAEHASIAILQVCWHEVYRRLPEQWRLVALWRLPRNVLFGDRLVGFFAVAPGEEAHLRAALESFQIPPSIQVRYGPDHAFTALVRSPPPPEDAVEANRRVGCL